MLIIGAKFHEIQTQFLRNHNVCNEQTNKPVNQQTGIGNNLTAWINIKCFMLHSYLHSAEQFMSQQY